MICPISTSTVSQVQKSAVTESRRPIALVVLVKPYVGRLRYISGLEPSVESSHSC